jgi:hypothetical protein
MIDVDQISATIAREGPGSEDLAVGRRVDADGNGHKTRALAHFWLVALN